MSSRYRSRSRSRSRDRKKRSRSRERFREKPKSRSRSRDKKNKHRDRGRDRDRDRDRDKETKDNIERPAQNLVTSRPLAQNFLNAPASFDIKKANLAGPKEKIVLTREEKAKAALARLRGGKKKVDYLERKSKGDDERHWRDKQLAGMTERDWRIFKEDFKISTRGFKVPLPWRNWDETSNLPDAVYKTIRKVGYKDPSPIQRQAIPIGLRNRDIVGIAETGSGKTCAFVIPMIVYIMSQPKITEETAQDGPYALIMAPTRELAKQIAEEATKFAEPMGYTTVCIVGGSSYQEQAISLRSGAETVICTPGRMYDCIERHLIALNQCNYVVLDEADRMIDMNFEPQIVKIMDMMPSSNLRPQVDEENAEQVIDENKSYRQTTMFSATMPPRVELLAKKYLRQAIFVAIGDRRGNAAENVEQRVEWVKENMRRNRLVEILEEMEPPGIIFCNTQSGCNSLVKFVVNAGFPATVLHAGKTQDQREANLAGFKAGTHQVLIATDVAARGIDVSNVQYVLNFDLCKDIEKYTHRIGRTGRAGKKGVAISFMYTDDTDIMYDLGQMLEKTHHAVPEEMRQHPAYRDKPGQVGHKRRRDTILYAKT